MARYIRRKYRKRKRTSRRRLQQYSKRPRHYGDSIVRGAVAGAAVGRMGNLYRTLRKRSRGNGRSSESSSYGGGGEAHNDYKKYSVRFGKRLFASVLSRRVLRDTVGRWSFGLADYAAWNRGSGNIPLESLQAGLAGTRVIAPVHLWDLTAVPQASLPAGTVAYPYPCQRLTFSTESDGGVAQWQHRQGSTTWITTALEETPSSLTIDLPYQYTPVYAPKQNWDNGTSIINTQSSVGEKSFLQSANVRMCLYGPQQAPTKYVLQLVQLSEDVTPGQTDSMATVFWQALAKPYGYSPLEIGNRKLVSKHMKVLKTRVITIDAPESIEDHVQARMRQVNFNFQLNRRCNYNWGRVADRMNMDEPDMPREADIDAQKNATTVHPRARVYLMIRALVSFQGPTGDSSELNSPSYDIRVHTSHRKVS